MGNLREKSPEPSLTAHLFKATYDNEILVTWILFVMGDTLYYPYGASSNNHREVMASNLMMWEAIKFGKKWDWKNLICGERWDQILIQKIPGMVLIVLKKAMVGT